jgi:predicted  nucleic acid-binding Zn-ribbon protein
MSNLLLMLSLGGLVCFFGLISLLQWRRINQLQSEVRQLQQQHQQLAETALGVGRKLITLQKELQSLANKLQHDAGQPSEYKAYSHAAKLLQQGESLQQVVQKCHLTHGEAELLASMHRAATGEQPK